MRTSKKLLSLFLAVVMAVTSCSVGLTAFAAEPNKSIWSTDADATASYDALDQLVSDGLVTLLQNDSIKSLLEGSLGMTITEDTSFEDVLGAVQPLLLGLLSKTSQEEFEESQKVSAGAYDYLNIDKYCSVCDTYWHANELTVDAEGTSWCPNGCKNTSTVVDEATGEETTVETSTITSTQLSYFTLVSLCKNYMNNSALSKDEQATLKSWYDTLIEYTQYSDAIIQTFIDRYESSTGIDIYNYAQAISALESFDFKATDEEMAQAEIAFSLYNAKLEKYGVPKEDIYIDSIADAIYYFHHNVGKELKGAYITYDAIHTVGTRVTWKGDYDFLDFGSKLSYDFSSDTDDLTASDFMDQIIFQTVNKTPVLDEDGKPTIGDDGEIVYHTEFSVKFMADFSGAPIEMVEPMYDKTYAGFINKMIDFYVNQLLPTYTKDALYGYAIKYSDEVNTKEDLDKMVADKMPEGWGTEECVLTDKEIEKMSVVFLYFNSGTNTSRATEYFEGETFKFGTTFNSNMTTTLPSVLKDTYVADYLALRIANKQSHYDIFSAFFPNFFASTNNDIYVTKQYVESGTDANIGSDMTLVAADDDGLPLLKFKHNHKNGVEADKEAINGFFQLAEDYAYADIVANLLGVELVNDDYKLQTSFDPINVADQLVEKESFVTLSKEQKKAINETCDFTGNIGTIILNTTLNNTIGGVVGNEMITGILNGLLVSKVDLNVALSDLWLRLNESVVGTIVELLPVLTVVLDELIIPILFNEEGDSKYAFLTTNFGNSILGTPGELEIFDFRAYNTTNGSYIGIDALHFNLNELLPAILHLLSGDTDYEYKYYSGNTVVLKDVSKLDANGGLLPGVTDATKYIKAADVNTTDPKYYVVKDQDGNQLTRTEGETEATFSYKGQSSTDLTALLSNYPEAVFTCEMTYESTVPYITGIYYVDELLNGIRISDISEAVAEAAGDEEVGAAVEEMVTTVAASLTEAVDTFVATPELVNNIKLDTQGGRANRGLNNIFVALPQLIDIFENILADKYGIDQDAWVYCYEGRIDGDEGALQNQVLEKLKSFAGSDDKDRKYDIFDTFAELLIENWMNAIISIANNVISTDNKIATELPVVAGLLNALGGFGEESIITDIANSVFQMTREDEFSFSFDNENTDKNNKFTGLSKNNAYFLITNLPRLVEVITDLIAKFSSGTSTEAVTVTTESESKVYAVNSVAARANISTYSSQDLDNVSDLIGNLDKMLSSLLADVTLNDFSLNKTDNIFAGIITMLSNYLGDDFADSADDIVSLINSYTYYITGCDTHKANGNNVDEKKVYTNDSLTALVVETYSLVEGIAAKLLEKYTCTYTLDDETETQYNLLVEAIDGVISPDVVSTRLEGDYDSAAKTIAKYNSWTNMAATTSRGDYKVSIDWNIKAGDKEAFYDGLAASLRVLTSIIGVLLIDSGLYNTVVTPVLGAVCTPNDISIEKYETLVADKEKTGNYDATLLAILTPVSEFINVFLSKPATTLLNTVKGLAGVLDDKNGTTIASIVNGALTPVVNEINGLANVVNYLTPTGANIVRGLTDSISKYGETDKNNALVNIKIKGLPLSGTNLIPIVNTLLSSTGIQLDNIDWNKLSTSKTPADVLAYLFEYAFTLISSIFDLDILKDVSAKDLLSVINQILEATDSPTMAYWTFAQYLQESSDSFKYPSGITAAMANSGVEALDELVAGIFPLLSSFGVNLGDSLQDILDGKLFTNEILTTLATKLYGALDGLDPTIKAVLNGIGIVTSTKDVAKLLTDKSYGATFSSAANTIKAQSSWSKVKNVNWGFKDGSSNAQQGFVNALVAILRPLNDVLAVFLNEGTLHLDDTAYELLCSLTVEKTTKNLEFTIGDTTFKPVLTYSMKNGVFTLTVKDGVSKDSKTSTLKIDLNSIKNLSDLKIEGTNGYNSAIIPLLEAFQCSNIKTYAQYQKDVAKAKDNLLLDVLNPIAGSSSSSLISKLAAKPVATLADVLPTVAMFIEADGLSQAVANLLAPVSYVLNATKSAIDLNELVPTLLESFGVDLNEILAGVGIKNFKLDVYDLEKTIAQIANMDVIIPLVNTILANKDINIKLPNMDLALLASFGDASTYTSKAVGSTGKYLTGKTVTNVDQGKVLVTVLRYVAEVLINNSTELKNLICSIDKVKNSDILSSILKSVFNTIGTASKDELVCAVFYLLSSNPSNAFWDYTAYETGSYSFSYPEGIDVDFLKNLPPMLDGLISGLVDLNGLITENLFTDSIISKLATGLYGAVEGVKINDSLNLTELLAQTGIDFSTSNVASLLVNEDYGQTFEGPASVIKAAGSWKNVNADSLKWGVTDRDSFFHALVAVLRPIYGVLDVLLNDAYLGLFDIVRIPGSNGYSSSIVPLMEAFSMYNIKTQYQYRQDMEKEYDAILLDIINPLWDKVEDILAAPLQTVAAMLPNLALFIGNDGLCQIIDNMFTPISALADAIRPVVDLNSLLSTVLDSLDVDLNSILSKIGVTNFSLDLYDLKETLKPLLGADSIIPLVNNILGMIKIGGTPLGIKLNDVDWLQLASHGTTIVSASQAATFGPRIFVEGNSSETLIAVLRYLIVTINTGDNYDAVSSLIAGLIGGDSNSSIAGTVTDVLSMLEGDTDTVIADLVELLQTIA